MRSCGTSGSAAAWRARPRPRRTRCSPRMVVLQVVAPGEIGGLERVGQALAWGLQGLGHDLHVAAVLDGPGAQHPFLAALAHSGITTHPFVLPGRAYLRERRAVAGLWRGMDPALDRAAVRLALGMPSDGFVVGWVGRLRYEEGLDVLLDAVPHATDLPLVVSVLGSGTARAELQARARDLRLDRILWHGAVPDAGRLFRAFDVFVLSSRTEGTPIVLFEAMAAEVPVIAARVGGVPDILSPDEAALVPPADPMALAAELRAVYRDPGKARERARRARERLRRDFSVEPWLARYERIYQQVSRAAPAALVR